MPDVQFLVLCTLWDRETGEETTWVCDMLIVQALILSEGKDLAEGCKDLARSFTPFSARADSGLTKNIRSHVQAYTARSLVQWNSLAHKAILELYVA